jgi:hypothetical protein
LVGLLTPTRPLVRHLSISLGQEANGGLQPAPPVVHWVTQQVQETVSAAERPARTLDP